MPRVRYMGSYFAPATIADPGAPRYAIVKEGGTIDPAFAADLELFPFSCTASELCELLYRIRTWSFTYSIHRPLGGGAPEITETGSGTVTFLPAIDSELKLVSDDLHNHPQQGESTGSGTHIEDDGVNPPVSTPVTPIGLLQVIVNTTGVPPAAPDTNIYIFNPADGLFYPRIEFSINSSIYITNWPQAVGVGTYLTSWIGTFWGEPMRFYIVESSIDTIPEYDDIQVSVSPHRWWKYAGASGDIWDENTGAELQNHSTTAN